MILNPCYIPSYYNYELYMYVTLWKYRVAIPMDIDDIVCLHDYYKNCSYFFLAKLLDI